MPYSLDISLHIQRTITSLLSYPKWKAYVRALLAPASFLQDQFIAFQNKITDELSRNSQTIILREYLVSTYGAGIYIINNHNNSPNIYVGHLDELVEDDDIYVGHASESGDSVYIGHDDESSATDFSFIIHVPTSLGLTTEQITQLKAFVDLYRFSSRNYNIQYY